MDDLLEAFARLTERLECLERRVSALEHSSVAAAPTPAPAAGPVGSEPAAAVDDLGEAGAVFPVVGKAMLGIAGAYLLRAVAESGSFPKLAVVALALAYAAMWLVWAARVPASGRFAGTAHTATAALILAPMLWELTLVFKVLSASVTAAVLSAFVVAASALAWKRSLASVIWVATVTAALTAFALLIASHELVPFLAALLFMAVVSESAACRNHWLRLRPLVAVVADLAICILLYIYSLPESARAEYRSIGTPVLLTLPSLLFLIYGASIAFRTLWLRQRITTFESGQTVIAFLLAAFTVYSFSPRVGALGIVCLLLSAGCYAAAFACFDRISERRNYHVFATWSAALVLAGSFLCLPPLALAMGLSVAALAATFLGVRTTRLTLELHGGLYLTAAAFASGLLDYAGRALAGTFPAAPGWMVWMVAASAVLGYAIGGRFRGEQRRQQLFRLILAVLAVGAAATFLVSAVVWLTEAGISPAIHHVAVIRTLIACALALALAFSGSRWQRIELVWIAYGALALVTVKLLFQDLRQGHPGSIAVSIFLYAVALILVPRMARAGRRGQ
jgi:hypothetical protein